MSKQIKQRGKDNGPPPGTLERRFESIIKLWRAQKLEHVRPTIDAYEKTNKMRSFWVDCRDSMETKELLELALHYIWDVSQGVE